MRFEDWLRLQKSTGTDLAALKDHSISAVLELSGEGATVPFIARYRKEKTGNIDEVAVLAIIDGKERFEEILKRQAFVTQEIEKQGKLTDALKTRIAVSYDMDLIEDLYLPYKQKRKTKAALAKEAGLEPLATTIWTLAQGEKPETAIANDEALKEFAKTFINPEKKIADENAAFAGALDILTERLAETLELRESVRQLMNEEGHLRSKKTDKAKTPSKYENYFDYSEAVKNLLLGKNSHRYLALRRGWVEEELTIAIGGPKGAETELEERLLAQFEAAIVNDRKAPGVIWALKAARNALKAYVMPAIDTELHKHLKEAADGAAISVFSENVRNLLMASPFGPKAVLGIDPGIRTGCKLALVNSAGQFVASSVIRYHTETEKKEAAQMIEACLKEAQLQAIAVGNGTAGRETEAFVRQVLKDGSYANVPVVMVNEAGASVYSASEAARDEFPTLDITVRGAISIARRLQDPLAELVKIDPKSIGVGQYQHDLNPSTLKKSLDHVVDSCVNKVGVNLNTASTHLLARVSGLGPGLAKAVVEFRVSKGVFKSRSQLLEVPRFTKKAFEQAAGFLRIPAGENPLDNTGVHPEQYPLIESYAQKSGKSVQDVLGVGGVAILKQSSEFKSEVGEFTFVDIVTELEKPGRDPRESFVPFSYRDDIHELKDLKKEMICPGIVTNVTNFGAFVDIGVHQDGLVHISQLADRFVQDPNEVVKPGDRVTVKVLDVNVEKKQISLTMRSGEGAPAGAFGADRAPRNDGPRAGGPRHDGPRHDGARRDGPRPGAPRSDSPRQEGPRPGGPQAGAAGGSARGGFGGGGTFRGGHRPTQQQGAPRQGGSRQGAPRNDGPIQGGPRDDNRRDAPRGDSRPQGSANFKNNVFGQLANFRDSFGAEDKAKKR